jgi:hypothetical protein
LVTDFIGDGLVAEISAGTNATLEVGSWLFGCGSVVLNLPIPPTMLG